jgi:hypothetical protein
MEDESGAKEDDGEEDDSEGLSDKYKKALAESGGPSNDDDHSFTRYLRASQMKI